MGKEAGVNSGKNIQQRGGLAQIEELNNLLPDSQKNIRDNALHMMKRLRELPEAKRVQLARFVTTRCYLVVVSTPDQGSAYRIFSVLNGRGLNLALTDILKAEAIGQIPAAEQDDYNDKWEAVEESLGRDAFQDLFAHIRTIHRKTKARNTLDELRTHVLRAAAQQQFIDETLLPMADAFSEIRGACYQSAAHAEEINTLLGWLKQIDNVNWQPPALLYMSRFRQDPERLRRFFRDLERLAAGLMIRRVYEHQRLERYARVLSAIEREDDLYAPDSPLQLTALEREQIVAILNGDIYNETKIRLPVLLRLDAALSCEGAKYNHSVLTVEHVLPQQPAPSSEWLKWWPDPELRTRTVHRLGNLVLLSRRKNSQAQNFDFARKKREYFNRNGVSPFAVTTQVLAENVWTPAVVERRQDALLGELKTIWRL